MPKINNNQLVAQFQDFRQKLYNCFESYTDSIMDLLDALAGNKEGASSIAELSLSPLFERTYNSIYKAIKESFDTSIPTNKQEEKLKNLFRAIASVIPQPAKRSFYLFAMDTTPHPRPYSVTMPERGYIYQPNTIIGNKPINIGHSYSIVSILPEKDVCFDAAWSLPFSGERVPIDKSGTDVGTKQIKSLMCDQSLPWHGKLSVIAADSIYSQRSFVYEQSQHKNERGNSQST